MAEPATLARPYAEAVFSLAASGGALERWSRALSAMAAVASHPDVLACLGDPRLDAEHFYGLLVSLVDEELTAEQQNFLRVLIANDRVALLPYIRQIFDQLKNDREGVLEVQIESAYPVAEETLQPLLQRLEHRFRRRIRPRLRVDPDLIGGVRVIAGDQVIDGSVRGRLEEMATALKA